MTTSTPVWSSWKKLREATYWLRQVLFQNSSQTFIGDTFKLLHVSKILSRFLAEAWWILQCVLGFYKFTLFSSTAGGNIFLTLPPWPPIRLFFGLSFGNLTVILLWIIIAVVNERCVFPSVPPNVWLLGVHVHCLQGPLRNTCGHFWLMIWEQKTKAVIMLNRVIEKGSVSMCSAITQQHKIKKCCQLLSGSWVLFTDVWGTRRQPSPLTSFKSSNPAMCWLHARERTHAHMHWESYTNKNYSGSFSQENR